MKETTQGMTIEKLENYRGLVAEMHSLSESINSLYDTYKARSFVVMVVHIQAMLGVPQKML